MLFNVAVLFTFCGAWVGYALAYEAGPPVTNIKVENKIFKPRSKKLPLIPKAPTESPELLQARLAVMAGVQNAIKQSPPPTMDMLERARYLKKSNGKGFV